MKLRFLITLLLCAATLVALDTGLGFVVPAQSKEAETDFSRIASDYDLYTLAEREQDRDYRTLLVNTALFARHPSPATITSAYIGTSRSKYLQPSKMDLAGRVNAAGNSYNEITYGVILQAMLLKQQFPNLTQVYLEASLLMRRPADRIIVEDDHKRYESGLLALATYQESLARDVKLTNFLDDAAKKRKPAEYIPGVPAFKGRSNLRPSSLLVSAIDTRKDAVTHISAHPLLARLSANGELTSTLVTTTPVDQLRPPIDERHIKVQRLNDVKSWYPWDGLFDVAARWAKDNGVELVLFVPPVRGDLSTFKKSRGLPEHLQDLERISRDYGVTTINLMDEDELQQHPELFSDEDHLATCEGMRYLMVGIEDGTKRGTIKRTSGKTPFVELTYADVHGAERSYVNPCVMVSADDTRGER